MKKIINRISNSKLLFALIIILQVAIIILALNPFASLLKIQMTNLISEVVAVSNDPDFRNASGIEIPDADYFRKEYLLNENFSEVKNYDYVFTVNGKMIVYRKDEKRIIYQGDTPPSLLDINRLINLIVSKTKEKGLIKEDEQPALKIFNIEKDQEFLKDYFEDLKNGDILAFFPKSKIVVLYNLQSNEISKSKSFEIKNQ